MGFVSPPQTQGVETLALTCTRRAIQREGYCRGGGRREKQGVKRSEGTAEEMTQGGLIETKKKNTRQKGLGRGHRE